MTITQTVEIPENRRLHLDLDIPPQIPVGPTNVVLTFPSLAENQVSANIAAWREFIAALDELGPLPGDDMPPRWRGVRELPE